MTLLIIKLIYGIAITQLWIHSTPAILFKRLLGFKAEEHYGDIKQFINEMIYCAQCSGFWIGLILYFTPLNIIINAIGMAAIISTLAELVSRKLEE